MKGNERVEAAEIIAAMLPGYGVREAVISSGTRSMPIVSALSRQGEIRLFPVLDERVAAFMATGMARALGRPVALVCTSGSAMLNYGPAVSEAYYSSTPLILITADRPERWIDQNDGQTIRQAGALRNIVDGETIDLDEGLSAGLPGGKSEDLASLPKFAAVGEALLRVSTGGRPIHINIRLSEPLRASGADFSSLNLQFAREIPGDEGNTEGKDIPTVERGKRVMLYIGAGEADEELSRAVEIIAKRGDIAIVTDNVSNVKAPGGVSDIESTLAYISSDMGPYAPELLITCGGTALSNRFKRWLRTVEGLEHWDIDRHGERRDTYGALRQTFSGSAGTWIELLSAELPEGDREFAERWQAAAREAERIKRRFLSEAPWSDLKAMEMILGEVPEDWHIECSNGMSVRNANICSDAAVSCNRGVNGIDGSTSTALGATISLPERRTLLLTGDMSALYDVGALHSGYLTPRFKMAVFDNGGGEIFRLIEATKNVEDRERLISGLHRVDWAGIARSAGMEVFEAKDTEELRRVLPYFLGEGERSAMLVVHTAAGNSAVYSSLVAELGNGK